MTSKLSPPLASGLAGTSCARSSCVVGGVWVAMCATISSTGSRAPVVSAGLLRADYQARYAPATARAYRALVRLGTLVAVLILAGGAARDNRARNKGAWP